MSLELLAPAKINLLLNVLGKRSDGFHDLETVIQPVPVFDTLAFERVGNGVNLVCSDPILPVDDRNLVYRAASLFLEQAGIRDGVRVHLTKRIPQEAGLGGGSSDAATTLLGLNQIFGGPFDRAKLAAMASLLGSDVSAFIYEGPVLASGRGERIQTLRPFPALSGKVVLLVRPGFGVPTSWAYRELADFPEVLNGEPGQAAHLVKLLQGDLGAAAPVFFNALELPVYRKYPILQILREFLVAQGVQAARMSGSGSTTFALIESQTVAQNLEEEIKSRFGSQNWLAHAALQDSIGPS